MFNESGLLVHDITDRLTRIIGSFIIVRNQGAGSLNVAEFANGQPWYFSNCIPAFGTPVIQINGTTLSWSANTSIYDILVWYGVY